jgi:hypothetical protein
MIFEVSKSNDWDYKDTVCINSIEDLQKFQEECGHSIIINFKSKTIEIYDGYRE